MLTAIAAHRLRVLLALLSGLAVAAVVVLAVVVVAGALTGTAAGTSGDYGAVY
ncbi:MAG TPA: hypothetical protein VI357_10115 [Mycobacteriales bacterium]